MNARFCSSAQPSPHSAPLRCSFALGAPGVRLPRRLPLSHWIKTSAAARAVPARATGQSFVRFCVQRLLAQCVLLENSALLATGDIPGRLAGCCAAASSSHLSRGLISADALELRGCGCEVAAAWGGTQAFLEPPKSYGGTPPSPASCASFRSGRRRRRARAAPQKLRAT